MAQEEVRNEVLELQKEWRREITEGLRELRSQNNSIVETLRDMREEFAKHHDVQSLEIRVQNIESDKAKLIGGLIALQTVMGIVIWFATEFIKK
jgi:hypothetical protein